MILSGDVTNGNAYGPRDSTEVAWRNWLNGPFTEWRQKAPHTIMVAGNHDTTIEDGGPPPGVTYLLDSGCEFGGFKFWGAPWVRKWDQLAFGLSDDALEKKWDIVPRGTNVLVCHGPPLGFGDMVPGTGRPPEKHHVGCKWLAHTIQRVKPKLLTCGHIHEGRGIYDAWGTKVVNSAHQFTVVELL